MIARASQLTRTRRPSGSPPHDREYHDYGPHGRNRTRREPNQIAAFAPISLTGRVLWTNEKVPDSLIVIVLSSPRSTHRGELIRVLQMWSRGMKNTTSSAESTGALRSGLGSRIGSAQSDDLLGSWPTVGNEPASRQFCPQSATGSAGSDALAAASTQVLRAWLDDDAADEHRRVGASA